MHSTQAPLTGSQASAPTRPEQSASLSQPPQRCVAESQTGCAAGQSELERHSTQLSVAGSQTGDAPPHAAGFIGVQTTQVPLSTSHAGVPARLAQVASLTHGPQA